MSTQLQVEGLIPSIQSLTLQATQIAWKIAEKERQLASIPEVIILTDEINDLRKSLSETQSKETELREQGKKIMLDNDMKEISMLDGTTIALHFTPWALVVEDESVVPEEFWKEKTTRSVDKTALKEAVKDGKFENEKVFIQKDCKFVIKNK